MSDIAVARGWETDGDQGRTPDLAGTFLSSPASLPFFGGWSVRLFRPVSHRIIISLSHSTLRWYEIYIYHDISPSIAQAAALCLSGVAALELFDSSTNTFSLALLSKLGTGDALSLLQAVGFGTGVVSRDSSVPCACVWLIHFLDVIATRRGKVNASILARN